MHLLCGTSGFSYASWKGSFYPADVSQKGMLAYYATRLPAVEVNNTFYRMPTASVLAAWRGQVPGSFRFAVKAPGRMTHQLRLANAAEPLSRFLRALAELGDTLGPVLYQLPPGMKKDLPRLVDFLSLLPAGGRSAFEFRHPSWLSDDVYGALASHHAALCVAESEKLEVPLVATADFGYLRLRLEEYAPGDVEAWAERILAQPWKDAFVFFKHEDPGKGPRLAEALGALASASPLAASP